MILDLKMGLLDHDVEHPRFQTKARILRQADNLILYHGTTDKFLADILEEGLLPRGRTSNSTYEARAASESLPDRVYLTSQAASKGWPSSSATERWGGHRTIIRTIPDLGRLVADEDSGKSEYAESIAWEGSCAHLGRMPPERILGYIRDEEYTPLRDPRGEVVELEFTLRGTIELTTRA